MEIIKIQQELTTRCTCNCLFCPRHVIGKNRHLGDISLKMSELVIQRYEELKEPFRLSISGFGEPLLYPGLFSWLQDVRHRCPEAYIKLYTNATLLDQKRAEWVIELLDEVQLNLGIPFKENFYELKNCSYDLVKENIENFYKLKGAGKPQTDIRILKTKYMENRMKEILDEWAPILPKGDALSFDELENWTGLIDEKEWGVNYPKPDITYICENLNGTYLTITKEGDAYACCYGLALPEKHPFVLGNIKNRPIKKLLNNNWRKLQQAMHRGRKYLDACSTCSVLRVSPPDARSGFRYVNPKARYLRDEDQSR